MSAVYRKTFKWLTMGVYHKLSAVMAALLIYEWIRCLADYWWEETFTIVNGVLFVSTIVTILVPSRFFSSFIQLVFLVGLNAAYSGYSWIPFEGDKKHLADWMSWLASQVKQLSPFIWISLSIWIIFHLIVWMRNRRYFIIGIVGIAMLSLTIADSLLTPLYLWDEIAWILFIGLGWLVASHFSSFKKQHPDNWEHLLEYPISLFVPILLIITLVMGAGLFVPSIKPILQDPYTAWKEAHGEVVASFVGDKGVSTNSPKSTGDSRSGYSRNDELLGNGFKFDYSPVMTVTTTKRSYWRGETKAFYNGGGWEEATAEKKELSQTIRQYNLALIPEGQSDKGKVEKIDQTFTMIRKDKYPVLFGAGPISTVVSINDSESMPNLHWLPQSWELRLPSNLSAYPKTYSIVSEVAVLDEEALRSGAAAQPVKDINPMYLQLPSGLPQRVRDLAAELTKDAAAPYDKVNKLVSYLQLNYKYTNEPDLTKRESKDFVDAFLFEMKEGYCDYFSSALAVLTRATGIPSRWVKGYSPGSLPVDPERMRLQAGSGVDMNPEGAGTYTVRNADAHSWVEVYFEGYGWVPFEPTAGFSYPYALPDNEVASTPDMTTPAGEDTVETGGGSGFHVPVWVFFLTAGALILSIAALRFRSIKDSWQRYRMGTDTVNQRIVKETNRLIRYGRKKGLDHNEFETVRETMARWSGRLTFLRSEFHTVQGAFEKAMYSSQEMTQEEAEQVTATVKIIRDRIG